MKPGSFFLVMTFILACDTLLEYHPKHIILEEHERNLTERKISRISEKDPTF